MLWGFELCIGALFRMLRRWRGGASPSGEVDDVNDTTQAMMIMILPV